MDTILLNYSIFITSAGFCRVEKNTCTAISVAVISATTNGTSVKIHQLSDVRNEYVSIHLRSMIKLAGIATAQAMPIILAKYIINSEIMSLVSAPFILRIAISFFRFSTINETILKIPITQRHNDKMEKMVSIFIVRNSVLYMML